MARAVSGRRIEDCWVWHPGDHRLLHSVVDFHDQPLGPKLTMPAQVLSAHDRERVQNVVGIVSRYAVDMKKCGVYFGAQHDSSVRIPMKGRPLVAKGARKKLKVPSS